MTVNGLLEQYQGQIVQKEYNAGYIALSYLVSFVGAASTLELINRRTWFEGVSNHLVLGSAAITMGGIAIWCMHFIGNHALSLAHGEMDMQIAYSSGFTALSFFIPIIVLLAAFYAVGTRARIAWWRVIVAGTLCGSAICGMHYLGNASIANYDCVYETVYIVGAAAIAIFASTAALAMLFIFQSFSARSWWKRTISAFILAGAVSGMHWCASVGTQYRLVHLTPKTKAQSRTATVIVVICLSIGACVIIAGSAVLRARSLKQAALRAQQITLGAVVFDRDGRLLIDSSGIIPSTVVTDFFLGKDINERFNIAHPQFHWMFQASRNWIGVTGLINGMKHHLAQLPHRSQHKDARKGIQLITDDGKLIEGYEVIFRELFCVAASVLSERLKQPLTTQGVLWDEILPKGSVSNQAYLQTLKKRQGGHGHDHNHTVERMERTSKDSVSVNYLEEGLGPVDGGYGRGSLMFLVRRATSDDEVQRLVSAGYRFVDPSQVSDAIRSRMQIQSTDFEAKLRDMRTFADQKARVTSGVHLSLFATRNRGLDGTEVLVQREARHLLPCTSLPINGLDQCDVGFLRQLNGLSVPEALQRLKTTGWSATSRQEEEERFGKHLTAAIISLRTWVQEPLFHDAILTSTIARLPFGIEGNQGETIMLALRLKVSSFSTSSSANCQWVPLSFFKMRQVLDQSQQEFVRGLHDEFDPMTRTTSRVNNGLMAKTSKISSKIRRFGGAEGQVGSRGRKPTVTVSRLRSSSRDSTRTTSTIHLCPQDGDDGSSSAETIDMFPTPPGAAHQHSFSNSGIVVFQEVTVNIESKDPESYNDLGPSWSQDTAMEGPQAQEEQGAGIELQPLGLGMGRTDVSVESRWLNSATRADGNICTMTSFVDALLAEGDDTATYL